MIRLVIIACLILLMSSCSTVATKKTEVAEKPVEPETSITPEVRATAENFVSDGVSLYQDENYPEAVDAWQQAIELIPGDAEVHNFMGISYHKMGDYDKALQQFEIATDLDSTYYEAFNNMGYMQFLKEDYDNALKSFQKSLAINPEYDAAILNRSKTQKIMNGELLLEVFELTEMAEQLDDVDQKIKYYQKILAIDSTYAEGHITLVSHIIMPTILTAPIII